MKNLIALTVLASAIVATPTMAQTVSGTWVNDRVETCEITLNADSAELIFKYGGTSGTAPATLTMVSNNPSYQNVNIQLTDIAGGGAYSATNTMTSFSTFNAAGTEIDYNKAGVAAPGNLWLKWDQDESTVPFGSGSITATYQVSCVN